MIHRSNSLHKQIKLYFYIFNFPQHLQNLYRRSSAGYQRSGNHSPPIPHLIVVIREHSRSNVTNLPPDRPLDSPGVHKAQITCRTKWCYNWICRFDIPVQKCQLVIATTDCFRSRENCYFRFVDHRQNPIVRPVQWHPSLFCTCGPNGHFFTLLGNWTLNDVFNTTFIFVYSMIGWYFLSSKKVRCQFYYFKRVFNFIYLNFHKTLEEI